MLSEFKWGIWIKFLRFGYLDFVFMSLIRIVNPEYERLGTFGLILAITILISCVVFPPLFIWKMYENFYDLKKKDSELENNYKAMVYQVDKDSHWRVFMPIIFFLRRFLFATILVMSLDMNAVFLQYVCLLVLSFFNFFYLLCYEPYKALITNLYVFAMEFFFLLLCSCAFMFTDATPSAKVKSWAAIIAGISMWIMVAANVVYVMYHLILGKEKIKQLRKQEKLQKLATAAKAIMVKRAKEEIESDEDEKKKAPTQKKSLKDLLRE